MILPSSYPKITDEIFQEMITVPNEELNNSPYIDFNNVQETDHILYCKSFSCPWDGSITRRPFMVWCHKNKIKVNFVQYTRNYNLGISDPIMVFDTEDELLLFKLVWGGKTLTPEIMETYRVILPLINSME